MAFFSSRQGTTAIPILIVLALLLCIPKFRELDERTTTPALCSGTKETIKFHELENPSASSETAVRHTLPLAPTKGNNDNSVTATGGPGGPNSFCSWPAYNLERQWVRDIICSNLNKITSRTSDSEDAEPNLLPNSTHIMFHHIPKTGGESLEAALSIKKNHHEWWDRKKEREEIGESNRLSIAIIRNPYSRMLSWFRFCLHGWRGLLPSPAKHCLLAHQYISDQVKENDQAHSPETVSTAFEGWLEEIFLSPRLHHSFLTSNYQEYLGGVSPLHVDYIIRFEHYAEDYALLAEALGVEKDLPKKNGSKNGEGRLDSKAYAKWKVTYNPEVAKLLESDYREIYTERGRTLVEMVFASDLRYFNYTF